MCPAVQVTRESRAEDLERVAQLEKEVAEKEYLCKRIMEEMKYFKMELQQRDQQERSSGKLTSLSKAR